MTIILITILITELALLGLVYLSIRQPAPSPVPTPTPAPTPTPTGSWQLTIVNQSTATAAEIQTAVDAVQAQVLRDYIPTWGSPVPGEYKIIFMDADPSAPGALGYHGLEGDIPTGRILVETARRAGVAVSSVLSHEVLEMLADPIINRLAIVDTSPNGDGTHFTLYMAENCDAVEQDSYLLNGVAVSNFVLPAWFDPSNTTGPFDFGHKLTKPLQLLPGGSYIGTLSGTSQLGWQALRAHKRTS